VELRQYRHVLALADHASFHEASEALGISQPALTESLFQIERDVGQRLFDRHGQTISPTVFGAIVIDTARKMLDSQEAMTPAFTSPPAGAVDQPRHSVCSAKSLRADFALGQHHGKIKSFT
jgi:DNA-binding transcriptional LysR family regulator